MNGEVALNNKTFTARAVTVFSSFIKHRELIWQLTVRNIKAGHKQSVLGISWIVLQPLAQMAIFTLIFTVFVKLPTEGIPYPIFSFAALMIWNFFSAVINRATNVVVEHDNLVRKIYFPREVLVYSAVGTSLINLWVNFIVLALLMAFFRMVPTVYILWVFPLLVICVFLAAGVGFFLSALNVFWRDTSGASSLAMQIWFYATPIIYSEVSVPDWLLPYYRLNPMVGVITGTRNAFFKGEAPDMAALWIAAALGMICFAVGLWFFKRCKPFFADVI